MRSTTHLIASLLLVAAAASFSAAGEPPELPLAANPPAIDGVLAPGEWAGAYYVSEFAGILPQAHTVAPELRTEAWIARTATSIVVAVKCRHDRLLELQTAATGHDGATWSDDAVEIFLDAQGTGYSYYHLIVNSAATIYDAWNKSPRNGMTGWDSGALAAGSIQADGFVIEVAMPLSAMNVGLNKSGLISLNLCRLVRYNRTQQAWCGGWHDPPSWNSFRLPGLGPENWPVVVENVGTGATVGANELTGELRNLLGRPVNLNGEFTVQQERAAQKTPVQLGIPAGGGCRLALPYQLTEAGPAQLRLVCRDDKGREIVAICRGVAPKPVCAMSLNTDVLFEGERPVLSVTLNVPPKTSQGWLVRLAAGRPSGEPLYRADFPIGGKTSCVEEVPLPDALVKPGKLDLTVTLVNSDGRELKQSRYLLTVMAGL